jgi:hypothetical protein
MKSPITRHGVRFMTPLPVGSGSWVTR